MADDLRTLAQAVVDADDDGSPMELQIARRALYEALPNPVAGARAILAALNTERAQGYARAMDAVADWARERLPAARITGL